MPAQYSVAELSGAPTVRDDSRKPAKVVEVNHLLRYNHPC